MKVYLPFAFLFFPAPLLAVNADLEKSNTEKVDSTITLQGVVIQDFRVNKHNLVPVSGTIIGRNQIVNTETNSIKEAVGCHPQLLHARLRTPYHRSYLHPRCGYQVGWHSQRFLCRRRALL